MEESLNYIILEQRGAIIKTTTMRNQSENIDEYIAGFPGNIQRLLNQVRATIKLAAPKAEETIKYGMPTFTFGGSNLVHFAAFKNHIGFYPVPRGIDAFKKELSKYEGSKSTVRFPLDKPLPRELITRIIKFRVSQSLAKAKIKKKTSK